MHDGAGERERSSEPIVGMGDVAGVQRGADAGAADEVPIRVGPAGHLDHVDPSTSERGAERRIARGLLVGWAGHHDGARVEAPHHLVGDHHRGTVAVTSIDGDRERFAAPEASTAQHRSFGVVNRCDSD